MSVRLNKALSELNIGLQAAVEFLEKNPNLGEIEANPNFKLSDQQFVALEKHFKFDNSHTISAQTPQNNQGSENYRKKNILGHVNRFSLSDETDHLIKASDIVQDKTDNKNRLEIIRRDFSDFKNETSRELISSKWEIIPEVTVSLDEIGTLPYECFKYFYEKDINTYNLLTSALHWVSFPGYIVSFDFLEYKNQEKHISIGRLFQPDSSVDFWNTWKKDYTFKISDKRCHISLDAITGTNIIQFAWYVYIESNHNYFIGISDERDTLTFSLWRVEDAKKNVETGNRRKVVTAPIKTPPSKPAPVNDDNVSPDIFISYSRKDKDTVWRFVNLFRDNGLNVWIDENGIYTGDAFKKVITKAIKMSKVFVFFSSKDSNSSDWTTKEISLAVNWKKKIIPVKIDGSDYSDDVIFDLVNLDFIDYQNNPEYPVLDERLVKSIKKECEK